MNSKSEKQASEDITPAKHFVPVAAKRRRLEGTQGTLIDSATTWNPSNTPASRSALESVWVNDYGGGVASQFGLNPSTPLSQLETSSLSRSNLPGQGNNGVDARCQDMDRQNRTSSSFMAPNYESSTMMVGASRNTVYTAPEYSTSHCMDWNIGGRLREAEPDLNTFWINQGQPDQHSWAAPFSVGPERNSSAQVHSYGANPMQWSESIRSNLLNAEVPFQTQTVVASQENPTTGFGSNISCAINGFNGLVQMPSGVDGNEVICFGMVKMFKPPQKENLSAYP